MNEKVLLRKSFKEFNPETTAYIEYELTDAVPDFSTFVYGSEHTVVLRNKGTRQLEQINFKISGDDGKFFPEARRLWGDIESDDYHTILVFTFSNGKLAKITASFCGNSMSRKELRRISRGISYAAQITKFDPFYEAHPDLR